MKCSPLEECGRLVKFEVQKNRGSWQAGNRFAAIAIDDEDEIPVMAVEHVDRTRRWRPRCSGRTRRSRSTG